MSVCQLVTIPARQGLVCSDPLSFFQDQNKPTKKHLFASFAPSRFINIGNMKQCPLLRSKRPIKELVEDVAEKLGVKPELICSGNKQRQYSEASSMVAFLAVEEVGHPAAEVARFLGVKRMSVHEAGT